MKRLLFALLLLPVVAAAQYRTNDFSLDISRGATRIPVGITFDKDTVIPLNARSEIAGLSISGIATLGNDQDSYVRVILKDGYNYEHLIYENFPLLADSLVTAFSNTAIETVSLDNVTPQSIRVELHHATLQLESLFYTTASANRGYVNSASIQKVQCQYIADRLNDNLEKRNMTWRAGVTSVSEMSYEEKKAMFGGKVPQLYGFDYYKGGIFVMPESEKTVSQKTHQGEMRTSQYVSEWDWRNRHGKNWMTSVKDQGLCKACWAFSAVGVLEAYINLYYNRLLNYDLSEEEIISCFSNTYTCDNGEFPNTALAYIHSHGIVTEFCFPYNASVQNCDNKCDPPFEKVSFPYYFSVDDSDENAIKQMLFKSPLTVGIILWNHAVVLAGYKTINAGDVIYNGAYYYTGSSFTVDSVAHANLIGRTAWLIKNSWNTDWGDNGYGYIVASETYIEDIYRILGSVESLLYTNSDIVWDDADGDGYFFWGIGPKPTNCPSWVPDTPDGDDSNANYGPLDTYGNLADISQQPQNAIVINTNVTYSTNSSISNNIKIVNGGKLTITGNTQMAGSHYIYVQHGGELVVDGGNLSIADLRLINQSKLTIKNNGKVTMLNGNTFNVNKGTVVDVTYGSIN